MPHTLLAQVIGSDDEQVLEAVETALEARLLAEDGRDGYRFTHDLIRETVENGLSAVPRRRLHRRIGQALEYPPGAPAESLAFHFSQSGEDGTIYGAVLTCGSDPSPGATVFVLSCATLPPTGGQDGQARPVRGTGRGQRRRRNGLRRCLR